MTDKYDALLETLDSEIEADGKWGGAAPFVNDPRLLRTCAAAIRELLERVKLQEIELGACKFVVEDRNALQAERDALRAELEALKQPKECKHPSSHGWGSIASDGTSDGETWCDYCHKQLTFKRAAIDEARKS